jgi:hypothetical protein
MKMLGRVLVLGRIATTDVPTSQTQAEVDPGIALFQAFFAPRSFGLDFMNVFQVSALLLHGSPTYLQYKPAGGAQASNRPVRARTFDAIYDQNFDSSFPRD